MKTSISVIASIIILIFISSGCCQKCSKKGGSKSAGNGETKELVIEQGFVAPSGQTSYTIESAEIKDSIITLTVKYLTKKDAHSFDLVFNGMYAKSLPPVAGLYLRDNNASDTGEKAMTEKLVFGLSKIKYQKSKSVYVNVQGYNEKLIYNY